MPMAKIELPYIQAFTDRHKRKRFYFRKSGCARKPLPGLPGSKEFMAAYAEAMGDVQAVGAGRVPEGSLSALIAAFYESAEFKVLKPSTRSTYRNMLEKLREKHGKRLVRDMRPKDIRALIDAKAATPEGANNLLKRLRTLLAFAVDRGWRADNPARDVRRLKVASDGHQAWSDADVATFEARWPAGSRERLAMRLLLYTGQRRSDVVSMGRQHVRDGRIYVVQVKTGARVAVPLHPVLAGELAYVPADQLSYLMTGQGAPFTAAGFGNWFGAACRSAGLEGLTAHGLRKTAARCLAQAGCTAHQIAAITGHKTLKEVEHYTRSVEQERLADDAMRAWRETGSGTSGVTPPAQSVKPARKPLNKKVF